MTGTVIGYARCPDCDASAHHTHFPTCAYVGIDPRDIPPSPSPSSSHYSPHAARLANAVKDHHLHPHAPAHAPRSFLDPRDPTDRAELLQSFPATQVWRAALAAIDAAIERAAIYTRWVRDPRHALQKERLHALTQLRLAEQDEEKEQADG